jgi:hypothetical protein
LHPTLEEKEQAENGQLNQNLELLRRVIHEHPVRLNVVCTKQERRGKVTTSQVLIPGAPLAPARRWSDPMRRLPRCCKFQQGGYASCIRAGGALLLTTYGHSSGSCVDPIEKKQLSHFLPDTPFFSFGTAGCSLACKLCQNWDISGHL